jgi:hypothetical protein
LGRRWREAGKVGRESISHHVRFLFGSSDRKKLSREIVTVADPLSFSHHQRITENKKNQLYPCAKKEKVEKV